MTQPWAGRPGAPIWYQFCPSRGTGPARTSTRVPSQSVPICGLPSPGLARTRRPKGPAPPTMALPPTARPGRVGVAVGAGGGGGGDGGAAAAGSPAAGGGAAAPAGGAAAGGAPAGAGSATGAGGAAATARGEAAAAVAGTR